MLQTHLAGLQLIHIQHIIDQIQKETGGADDLLTTFLLLFLVTCIISADLDHTLNAIDWCPDIVAHPSKEVCLCHACTLCMFHRTAQTVLIVDLLFLLGRHIPAQKDNFL